MKKIINYISIAFTAFIVILALYVMIFGAIARKNNQLLSIFGYSYSYVPTASMKGNKPDSFDENTIVITKKVKFETIKIDDVIVFQDDNKLIIHRVYDIEEDGSLVTLGDNNGNNYDKTKTTAENFQGKMIKHFKFFDIGENTTSYQFLALSIIIIGLVIYVIFQVFKLIIEIHQNKLRKIKEQQKK